MNKKLGVVSSVVVILGLGLSFTMNEMNTEAAPIKKCSISFDAEKESKVTSSMIEHALEKKYHFSDKKLSFEKKQTVLTHTGNYHVDLIEKDSFLHETKLSTSVSFIDQTGPHIKQLKNTLEYGTSVPPNHLYEAKDKIDGNCPVTIHQLDTHKLGKQSVEVTSKDRSGNKSKRHFEVTICDTQKPKIKNINDCTIPLANASTFRALQGVQGTDNADGDITSNIQVSTETIPNNPGTYSIKYQLKDHSGNEAVQTRKVTVLTAPAGKAEESSIDTAGTSAKENEAPTDTNPVEGSNTTDMNDPTASSSETGNQPQAAVSTLSFLGTTIPFVHANGADSAPSTGCGTWTGTGAVDDNAPTHFIGHNPGDFSPVMNITTGTPITVVDDQGNTKTYTVYEVLNVNDDGTNADNPSDNTWDRVIDAGGERISLQTCITDSVNRIVLAR